MKHLKLFNSVEQIARLGSIRAAAEALAINSTALNRQILGLEEELGQPIFERLPRGVSLNTAGEMFLIHARQQMRDFDRLKGQLADLSGVRRGHVTIASTKAAMPYFLPKQIKEYVKEHPSVTFEVNPCDIETAQEQLVNLEADLAIVFEPLGRREFLIIDSIPQDICVVFDENHPLAGGTKPVRLSECLQYQLALPANATGIRSLLDIAVHRSQQHLRISIESEDSQLLVNSTQSSGLITFDIPLGLSRRSLKDMGLKWRVVDPRDMPTGRLYVGQLKDRSLSVAALKFAMQIISELQQQTSLCD
jgi:DNA-binding transcriptional LysR family regulator